MKSLSRYYLLAVFLMIGLTAACTKGDDTLPATTPTTQLKVINAYSQAINFYVNGARQNNNGTILPGAATNSLSVPIGEQLYSFKLAFDRETVSNFDTLFTLPLRLDTSRYGRSLFVTGRSRNSVLVVTDTLNSNLTANNQAAVRFLNASANVPALRVVIDDVSQFSNVAYKTLSGFKAISSGTKTIQIYAQNGSSPLLSTTPTLTSRFYTLFVQGSLNGTGENALRVVLIPN